MENRLFCAKMTGQGGGTAARGAEKKGSFFFYNLFLGLLV